MSEVDRVLFTITYSLARADLGLSGDSAPFLGDHIIRNTGCLSEDLTTAPIS